MEQSLFIDLVQKYFPRLVLSVTKTINGVEGEPKPYYFQRFLGRKFSITGKWEALSVSGSRVMADIIAMDSSLPLKKRPALSQAAGEIPKLGMEMALNESDLTNLQVMQSSTLVPEGQIIQDLFRDTASVVLGQYERIEHMFLEGLSTGAVVVAKGPNQQTAAGNVGTEIRLDFQYRPGNMYTSAVSWDNPASKPLTEISKMVDKSKTDGNPIRLVMLDPVTMGYILANDEAKDLYAQVNNVIQGISFPPTFDQLNVALKAKWGYTFEVIERTTRYQIDGIDYDVQPWATGQVIGINNEKLGDLVWSFIAEMNSPVAGVVYQKADEFILASKYRVNRPSLAEFTSSQSRALPVIADTKQIYHMDSTVNATT